jgi:hypothetical protein
MNRCTSLGQPTAGPAIPGLYGGISSRERDMKGVKCSQSSTPLLFNVLGA